MKRKFVVAGRLYLAFLGFGVAVLLITDRRIRRREEYVNYIVGVLGSFKAAADALGLASADVLNEICLDPLTAEGTEVRAIRSLAKDLREGQALGLDNDYLTHWALNLRGRVPLDPMRS